MLAMTDTARVGEYIARRREELGYDSQQLAAAAAKVSPTTWGQLERGKVVWRDHMRRKLTRFLNWTEDSFELIAAGKEPKDRAANALPGPLPETGRLRRVRVAD